MIAGNCECPFRNKLTIVLCGNPDDTMHTSFGTKVIGVHDGGELLLYGQVYEPSWTTLATTAAAGSKDITLVEPVQWRVGDNLVITTTDFSDQNERRKVAAVNGQKVTLDAALTYTHYSNNFKGIEMRGEVLNLDRRIVITGDSGSDAKKYGGHTMFLQGSTVSLHGVEVTKSGQSLVMGRYPIHWHVAKNVTGKAFVHDCSIHDNYQRCLTIHDSHGIDIRRNAAYNTFGHCYFLEVATEVENFFSHNIAVSPKKASGPLPTDNQPTGFWITNPDNTFLNNVAVGGDTGFWIALPHVNLVADTPRDQKDLIPRFVNIRKFAGNVAHSSTRDCLHFDNGPDPDNGEKASTTNVQLSTVYVGQNYNPYLYPYVSYFKDGKPINGNKEIEAALLEDFTAYKCVNQAVWMRVLRVTFRGLKVADSKIGFTSATGKTTILENAIFVGQSDNIGLGTVPFTSGFPPRGLEFYDGPNHFRNIQFFDFPDTYASRKYGAIGQLYEDTFSMDINNRAEKIRYDASVVRKFHFPKHNEDGDKQLHVRDLDGSLTGRPPKGGFEAVIVNNQSMFWTKSCVADTQGENYICPSHFNDFRLKYNGAWPSGFKPTNGVIALHRADKINNPLTLCGGGSLCSEQLEKKDFTGIYVRNKTYYVESDLISITKINFIVMTAVETEQTVFAFCVPQGATVTSVTYPGGPVFVQQQNMTAVKSATWANKNWNNQGVWYYDAGARLVWVKYNYRKEWMPVDINLTGGTGSARGCTKPAESEGADDPLPPLGASPALDVYPVTTYPRDTPCVQVGSAISAPAAASVASFPDINAMISINMVSSAPNLKYQFEVSITDPKVGMIALGIPPGNAMVGSDAIIGYIPLDKDNNTLAPIVEDYFISARKECNATGFGVCKDATQNILDVSMQVVNGVTTLTFTRQANTGDSSGQDLQLANPGQTQTLHIAYNRVRSVSYHDAKKTISIYMPGGACANGIKTDDEECDDKNMADGDGCTKECKIEQGWECSGSPSVCSAVCGDKIFLQSLEECDDGNKVDGDGCSSSCTVESGWRCSNNICVPNVCGDGYVMGNETCDDKNTKSDDGCSSTCQVEPSYTCSKEPSVCVRCGNGVLEGSETCDDGNNNGYDGCSAACQVEKGWNCNNTPSKCSSSCGDGIKVGTEGCDDGNLSPGDGCSSTCQVEVGWACNPVCNSVCGDGYKRKTEQCDDGNVASNDGCSGTCTVEVGYTCSEASSNSPSICKANVVPTTNKLEFSSIPSSIPKNGTSFVRLYYEAKVEAVISANLRKGGAWDYYGGSEKVVRPGAGFVNIAITTNKGENPADGTTVWILAEMKQASDGVSLVTTNKGKFEPISKVSASTTIGFPFGTPVGTNNTIDFVNSYVPRTVPAVGTIYLNIKYSLAEPCVIFVSYQQKGGSYKYYAGTNSVVSAGVGEQEISLKVSNLNSTDKLTRTNVYLVKYEKFRIVSKPHEHIEPGQSYWTTDLVINPSINTTTPKPLKAIASSADNSFNVNNEPSTGISSIAFLGIGIICGVVVTMIGVVAYMLRRRYTYHNE